MSGLGATLIEKNLEQGRAEGRAEERSENYNTIVKNLLQRNPDWTREKAEEVAAALMKD